MDGKFVAPVKIDQGSFTGLWNKPATVLGSLQSSTLRPDCVPDTDAVRIHFGALTNHQYTKEKEPILVSGLSGDVLSSATCGRK